MPHKPRRVSLATRLSRNYVELLTTLAVLFVLQTGLVPFDFLTNPDAIGSRDLFSVAKFKFALADIVSNIFLYFPIGLLTHWSCRRKMRSSVLAFFLAIMAGFTLSLAIEWVQSYSPARVSSLIDLFSNTIGAAIGTVSFWLVRGLGKGIRRLARAELQGRPLATLVKVYCTALVIVAVLPFSFSFDKGLLKKSLKSASIVPFSVLSEFQSQEAAAIEAEDSRSAAFARWKRMKCWSRWGSSLVSFGVLAWLVFSLLRSQYGFKPRDTCILAFWYGSLLAVALSLMQLPIITRGFDITDIIVRIAGFAAGLVLRTTYKPNRDLGLAKQNTTFLLRIPRIAFVMTAGYIAYIGTIPLTFATRSEGLEGVTTSANFLPFFGYFATRFDIMMADVMEKFMAYAALATLLVMSSRKLLAMDLWHRIAVVSATALALSTPLEIVQSYMPVRVASLTDLILAAAGAVTGVLAHEKGAIFLREALAISGEEGGLVRQPAGNHSPNSTDELMGTLLDPSPSAPSEPSVSPVSHRSHT